MWVNHVIDQASERLLGTVANSIASLAERIASETPRLIKDIILDANIELGQDVFVGGSVVVSSGSLTCWAWFLYS